MKQITLSSLLFTFLIITSCGLDEKEILPLTDSIQKEEPSLVSSKSSWFSFREIISDPKWLQSDDIMWRVEQCQIPNDQLSIMPTDTLVSLCANYPFFGDFIFANSMDDGITATMSLFNGFKELVTRQDASECLLSLFSNSLGLKANGREESNLDKLKSVYIKLVLSKLVSQCFNSQDVEKLKRLITVSSHLDNNYLTTYANELLLESLNTTSRGSTSSVTALPVGPYIQTYFGQNISVIYRTEMDQDAVIDMVLDYLANYPNAEILDLPSTQYNCHSYAWNIADGGSRCWINSSNYANQVSGTYTVTDNISPYWTNDRYEYTSDISSASKIFYYKGDHSAVVSNVPGKYESKWGSGPLMRHSPTYCPAIYCPNYRSYFRTKNYYGLLSCSAGIGEIQVGESCTYTTPFVGLPYGYTSYIWDVYDSKNDESVLGTYATITNSFTDNNGFNAEISISKRGIYYVRFKILHPLHNNLISTWEALVTI